MNTLNQDIKDKIKRLSAFEKIIFINIIIYLLGWVISYFYAISRINSLNWLVLPNTFSEYILKPWTLITYGFTHIEFWHITFNMLILYFIGRSFSNLFKTSLSLNVYFLGIICGGIMFLLASSLFSQGFLKHVVGLVGASAGVHATLIFLGTYMPNFEVKLIAFTLKLKYLAFIIVGLDIFGLFGDNPGGNIAHLGGDSLGYYYAMQLKLGRDIGKPLDRIMNTISNWFKRSNKSQLKTVYKKKKTVAGYRTDSFKTFNKQKRIDIILDKISKSGYDSLTNEEKEFLFKAGKD